MTELAESRRIPWWAPVLAALVLCALGAGLYLARTPPVLAPSVVTQGKHGSTSEQRSVVSLPSSSHNDDGAPRVAVVSPSDSARRTTGRLLAAETGAPIVDCAYGTIADLSEPFPSLQVLGVTGNAGEWFLETVGEKPAVHVAFLLEPYCRVVFVIAAPSISEGGIVLEVPEMGRCEVRLDEQSLNQPASKDIDWGCNIEPRDRMSPNQFDSVSRRTWSSSGRHGERIVQVEGRKVEGLDARATATFLAPLGAELVVGSWSVDHDLRPPMVRATVPSVVHLRAVPKTLGVWVHYHHEGSPDALGELSAHVLRVRGGIPSWVTMAMSHGRLFLAQEWTSKNAPRSIELRAPDGEFFSALLDGVGQPTADIDWWHGRGVAPMEVVLPVGSEVLAVWQANGNDLLVPIELAGPLATSARQYAVDGRRVLISGPKASPLVVVVVRDGIVEVRGGLQTLRLADGAAPRYCVVPPQPLLELQAHEALLVELQVAVLHGGVEKWLRVTERRLTARDLATDWSIQTPPEARYRAVWKRMAEKAGAWKAVATGEHLVAGPEAVLAVTGSAK